MLFLFLALVASAEGRCENGLLVNSGLTCEQKKELLDIHNELRNLVASGKGINLPPAQDMLEMRWSDVAANTAQILADQCTFEHNTTIGGIIVGQNLAIKFSKGKVEQGNIIKYLTDLWIDEGKLYKAGKFEYTTGHYSQMIWGDSGYVGCGYSEFKQDDFDKSLLVCNYLPPGNYLGKKPYTYGKLNCGKHGIFKSSKYNHLCVEDQKKSEVC